jgi:glutathione synthase/RimK-type ligase-like ATP-grasp enzyme
MASNVAKPRIAAVIKPVVGGTEVYAAPRNINPRRLKSTPVLYQRFVQGVSLRIYVVHRRVVACGRIHEGTTLDWRTESRGVTPFKLDRVCSRLAVKAAAAVGMRFAAIDLVLTDDGPQFFDVNPTPFFVGFEQLTGLDVGGPLADDLFQLANRARRQIV